MSPVSLVDAFGQRLRPPLFVPGPVFPLGLGVDQQQVKRHRVVVVEIDDPHPAALARARPAPANLAQAAGPGNEIATGRFIGDQVDHHAAILFECVHQMKAETRIRAGRPHNSAAILVNDGKFQPAFRLPAIGFDERPAA